MADDALGSSGGGSPGPAARVGELLRTWQRAGAKPPIEELCSDCPELVDQVKHHIQQLLMGDSAAEVAVPSEWDRAAAAGKPGANDKLKGGGTSDADAAARRPAYAADGRLGQYRLLETLGEGGMGVVWRATDLVLDRDVAIKVLKVSTPKALSRFLREARAVAKLNHPNVVSVHHVLQEGGDVHVVMELLRHSLADELERDGPLPWRRAAAAARDAAAGLVAAHAAGLVHRDVKPSNLLRTHQDGVKVVDFGLVHSAESAVLSLPTGGTPAFMSPEQCRGDAADARSDVYSLGCTLYALLTGRAPFAGERALALMQKHCEEPLPDPRSIAPHLPAAVCRIIARAGEKRAADRYATAAAMRADLEAALDAADESSGAAGAAVGKSSVAADTESTPQPAARGTAPAEAPPRRRVVIAYKRNAQPDAAVLARIEGPLRELGYDVFVDRHLAIGVRWAQEIELRIRDADAVIPLLSAASAGSEMLAYELQVAHALAAEGSGKPRILPVRVGFEGPLPPELAGIVGPLQYFMWKGPADDASLVAHLRDSLASPRRSPVRAEKLESVGGAVPLDSKFYVARRTDRQFLDAVERRDAIVLIKGARQTGKTSLLARGLRQARDAGVTAAVSDFQKLTAPELATPQAFYVGLGGLLADQLDLDARPEDKWDARRAANVNFERYVRREVLGAMTGPLVWALDEVDRLFGCAFGGEVFALFRTWHNERALDPSGPWGRLTLAIAYATEAHLFIRDVNQSPFNVGTRLAVNDFTLEQVAELNGRYGSPLADGAEVRRLFALVGGQPFLVQRGLYEITSQGLGVDEFNARAAQEDGPYGDHLRRILVMLAKDAELTEVVRGVLRGQPCPDPESFYRLRAAGLLSGTSAHDAAQRCGLYQAYLGRHLT